MSSLSWSLRVVLACMTAPFSMWPCEESRLVPASFVRLLRTTALKWCFLALDGHVQAPLTYFEGAGLKNARVSSNGSRITSFSGPPAPKNSHVCSKKMQKMVFFRPEMVFFGLGHSPAAPPALFCGCWTEKRMCFVSWRPYNRLFRPASTKKQPFLLKKCQKWRFLSLKWCFLAPGGHLQPPLPYGEGAGLQNTRVLSIRSLLTSVSGPPTPKNSNFSSKNAKNGVFLP